MILRMIAVPVAIVLLIGIALVFAEPAPPDGSPRPPTDPDSLQMQLVRGVFSLMSLAVLTFIGSALVFAITRPKSAFTA